MVKKAVSKPVKVKKANGRPIIYTRELGKKICDLISQGKSLRVIEETKGMPSRSSIVDWVIRGETGGEPLFKDFSLQYAHAKEVQAELYAEQMIEISDNEEGHWVGKKYIPRDVQRDKLRVDTRKYIAGVSRPKKYGQKISAELTGKDGVPLIPDVDTTELARRMAFIFAQAEKENQTKGKPNAIDKSK